MSAPPVQTPPQRVPNGRGLIRQLITAIGNKRALLGPIGEAVERVRARLGGRRLHAWDAFSGSGVVSRLLKAHAEHLVSSDLEEYAAVLGRCHLRNHSEVDLDALGETVAAMNRRVTVGDWPRGFFEELYAPRDEAAITREDRVFYTRENARRIDRYRAMIGEAPADLRDLLLGPLLSEASVHANTAGVFKGFYKDRRTGAGRFGGSGGDALARILGTITMETPWLSEHECAVDVRRVDANALAGELRGLDLAYFDPPYNQHPYGSNYFMLNLIARGERPVEISRVSGIPADWRRSGYNVRTQSLPLLQSLIDATDASHVLISFSDEGFIAPREIRALLSERGRLEEFAVRHSAFRGSRNFRARAAHVREHLFLLERGAQRSVTSTATSDRRRKGIVKGPS